MDLSRRPALGAAGIRFHHGRNGIVVGEDATVVEVARANRQVPSRQVVGRLRRA